MRKIYISILLCLATQIVYTQAIDKKGKPEEAASIKLSGTDLQLVYMGKTILSGKIGKENSAFYLRQVKDNKNGTLTQVFSITASDHRNFRFTGTITGSPESFACEAERKQSGTVIVRHTYGPSRSLLNRAVYDRNADWVLSVDMSYSSSDLEIIPETGDDHSNKFSIAISGNEIVFRFRPHYYQKHRGLKYFEPENYRVWDKSVVGWCSWFAFKNSVNESDIRNTADVISEKMKPFGLEYLQIDDGYQQETAEPEKWIIPNSKFPSGMDGLAGYIASKGLKPGIWTNVAFTNRNYVETHKNYFVTDKTGDPVTGRWLGYAIDGSNPEAVDKLIRPVYRSFREMGWKYFKLDALRHLRYEGYNSNSEYFDRKKADRVEAFRNVAKAVRQETGSENFLLACWGARPELIGIVDGCRIGNDGYGYETLTQFNSFNNIIWRNDPDHIELTPEEAYRSCMVTSLTGSLFMLTDKPEIYKTQVIEPALRSIPVLFTLPGQIFDVDPSSTDRFGNIDTDLSGSGERAADANRTSPYDLFLLEINKSFENWLVLGRAGERTEHISFVDLGLPGGGEYLVFEFWTKKYLGSFTGGFDPGPVDSKFNCQVFCIRERLDHPQLLATSRHITCGGTDLMECSWSDNIISGKSELVANDSYTIYLFEPAGAEFRTFSCEGTKVTGNRKSGNIRQITLLPVKSGIYSWQAAYQPV